MGVLDTVVNTPNSSVTQDTERGEESTQERTRALARINLAEEGRRVAAVRRAETHFGRKDPIAWPSMAKERSLRLCFGRIQREGNRGEQVKRVMRRRDERRCFTAGQHRL